MYVHITLLTFILVDVCRRPTGVDLCFLSVQTDKYSLLIMSCEEKLLQLFFPLTTFCSCRNYSLLLNAPNFTFAYDTLQTYPSISLVCCSERPASLVMMSLSILASNLVQQEQTRRSEWLVLMLITSSCFGILHVYAYFGILLQPRITLVLWPKLVSTQVFVDLSFLPAGPSMWLYTLSFHLSYTGRWMAMGDN